MYPCAHPVRSPHLFGDFFFAPRWRRPGYDMATTATATIDTDKIVGSAIRRLQGVADLLVPVFEKELSQVQREKILDRIELLYTEELDP